MYHLYTYLSIMYLPTYPPIYLLKFYFLQSYYDAKWIGWI